MRRMERNSSSTGDEFTTNGYLTPLDILTPIEAEKYYFLFQEYEKRLGGKVTGKHRFKTHLLLPWMHELATHNKIVDILKQLLGPDILLWSTDMFPKDPGTGKVCSWHQDSTYVGMQPPDALTVWLALTASDDENGCVMFSRGSHTEGQIPHNQTFSETSMLLFGQEIPVAVKKETVVNAILKPGQASIHHIMTVHASAANTSNRRRVGIAFRYCAARVKQSEGHSDSAFLVCGIDHGTFPLEPVPKYEFEEHCVYAHDQALRAFGPTDIVAAK